MLDPLPIILIPLKFLSLSRYIPKDWNPYPDFHLPCFDPFQMLPDFPTLPIYLGPGLSHMALQAVHCTIPGDTMGQTVMSVVPLELCNEAALTRSLPITC